MFGKPAQRFLNVGVLFCGAARPTPPATWDVASQIAPHGAGKSNRKRKHSNAFSSATPVFLFIIALALREAHNGSAPATAGAWGRHQPPHESILTLLSKNNIRRILCPQGHHLGLNALRLRGGRVWAKLVSGMGGSEMGLLVEGKGGK